MFRNPEEVSDIIHQSQLLPAFTFTVIILTPRQFVRYRYFIYQILPCKNFEAHTSSYTVDDTVYFLLTFISETRFSELPAGSKIQSEHSVPETTVL